MMTGIPSSVLTERTSYVRSLLPPSDPFILSCSSSSLEGASASRLLVICTSGDPHIQSS